MGVPDGAGGNFALQGGVPALDVGGGEPLQHPGADVGQDLLCEQRAVTLLRPRADAAGAGPLLDTLSDIGTDRDLRRLDRYAVSGLREDPVQLGQSLAPRALEALVMYLAAATLARPIPFQVETFLASAATCSADPSLPSSSRSLALRPGRAFPAAQRESRGSSWREVGLRPRLAQTRRSRRRRQFSCSRAAAAPPPVQLSPPHRRGGWR